MNHTTQLLMIIGLMLKTEPMYKRVIAAVRDYADLVGSTEEDMIAEITEFVRTTTLCEDIMSDEDVFANLAKGLVDGPPEGVRAMLVRHADAHGMSAPEDANLHFAVLHCALTVIIHALISAAPDIEKAVTEAEAEAVTVDEDAPAPTVGEDGSLSGFSL